MLRRLPLALLLVASVAGGLAACSNTNDATPGATVTTGEAGTTVNVELSEFRVDLDQDSADAGGITFVARNDGTTEHELVVVRSDLDPDALPTDTSGDVAEDQLEVVDEVEGARGWPDGRGHGGAHARPLCPPMQRAEPLQGGHAHLLHRGVAPAAPLPAWAARTAPAGRTPPAVGAKTL